MWSRQSWAFFQNDFAGRIANKVMQTGPAMRESLVSMITAVWYILVYGTSAVVLLASADPWLALPILVWFAGYAVLLRMFVPRMRDRSKDVSEARSILTGRIVDTYTNILTVKLFARAREEDAYVRDAVDEHTGLFHASLRLNTLFVLSLSTLNAAMVTGVGAARDLPVDARRGRASARWRWRCRWPGRSSTSPAGSPIRSPTIFENIGVVQEGMSAIARAARADRPRRCRRARRSRTARSVSRTSASATAARRGVIDGLSLARAAGREDRPGRPLRRRQVDAGQPAAALLRPRRRPHPDRRPGHRRGHAGIPARADLGGDAGHLAAAPLDPRQHPLWPAGRERGRDRARRRSSRMRTNSSSISRTGGAGAATTRRSASAA